MREKNLGNLTFLRASKRQDASPAHALLVSLLFPAVSVHCSFRVSYCNLFVLRFTSIFTCLALFYLALFSPFMFVSFHPHCCLLFVLFLVFLFCLTHPLLFFFFWYLELAFCCSSKVSSLQFLFLALCSKIFFRLDFSWLVIGATKSGQCLTNLVEITLVLIASVMVLPLSGQRWKQTAVPCCFFYLRTNICYCSPIYDRYCLRGAECNRRFMVERILMLYYNF